LAHLIDDDFLRSFFGLGDTQEDLNELEDIRSRLIRLQFKDGEDICTVDAEPDGMYFLESGVALVLDRDGEQLNVMHEGTYFGEYGVLAQQRRLSTVRSRGRTVVYKLTNEDMMAILSRHQELYGEFMKRVYSQVSHKHSQLLTLSRMQRGVLRTPGNRAPISRRQLLLQYGTLGLIFLLTALFLPADTVLPVFILPLAVMLVHVVITRRTLESLIAGGLMGALLVYRQGLSTGYTDALMETMSSLDNVYTVLVMALMGGMVTLIEASGAVTAFKKQADKRIKSKRGALLATLGILAVTAIDDALNLLCAVGSLRTVADEQKVPREDSGFLLSFLPTVLCSFFPFSLWGIFVVGAITPVIGKGAFSLLCRSIPLNFFSIVALLACVLFCFGLLPRNKVLREARKRVEEGGELWPAGSERYIPQEEEQFWGSLWNLVFPVILLAVGSLAVRSLYSGTMAADSAVGLVFTLMVMFLVYCGQGLLSPEEFFEHLVRGIENSALPIILYLLTMCFTALLQEEALGQVFDSLALALGVYKGIIPAGLFLLFTLLTLALGSSWAMFVIGFPAAIHMCVRTGLPLALCTGAICAAGIAGEKCCAFTSDNQTVGSAIGCDPVRVLRVRVPYSLLFSAIALALYAVVGFLAA
jgi:Na+/H+ antiporter NhaC